MCNGAAGHEAQMSPVEVTFVAKLPTFAQQFLWRRCAMFQHILEAVSVRVAERGGGAVSGFRKPELLVALVRRKEYGDSVTLRGGA